MRQAIAFILPVVLIVGLWTIRNFRTLGAFVPFSTGSGQVLFGGSNTASLARADGLWIYPPDLPESTAIYAIVDEVEEDRAFQRAAWRSIWEAPAGLVALNMIVRVGNLLFGWHDFEVTKWPLHLFWLIVAGRCASLVRSWLGRWSTRRCFGPIRGFVSRWSRSWRSWRG